jgi:arginine decarboxylase
MELTDVLLERGISCMPQTEEATTAKPVFTEALQAHVDKNVVSFHGIPASNPEATEETHIPALQRLHQDFHSMMSYSTTCTHGRIDSLSYPTSSIKKAQEYAADSFYADDSFFTTNGSTGAIQTIWQEVVSPDDIVIIDDVHKAHIWAAIATGATLIYAPGKRFDNYGLIGLSTHKSILNEIRKLKEANALDHLRMVVLTQSYDGLIYDTLNLMRQVWREAPQVVIYMDEAWGSYFSFHPLYRGRTAMCAAEVLRAEFPDLSCYSSTSPHKGLYALLRGYGIINRKKLAVDHALTTWALHSRMSTSPCPVGLAWVDASIVHATEEGEAALTNAIALATYFKHELERIGFNRINLTDFYKVNADNIILDPTKITINLPRCITGNQFRTRLLNEFSIHVTKSTLHTCLFTVDMGKTVEVIDQTVRSMKAVRSGLRDTDEAAPPLPPLPDEVVIHPAFMGKASSLDIRKAFYTAKNASNCACLSLREIARLAYKGVQTVCADVLTPYPPGQALARFGEVISGEVCDYLLHLHQLNTEIHGVYNDHNEPMVRVFTEKALCQQI